MNLQLWDIWILIHLTMHNTGFARYGAFSLIRLMIYHTDSQDMEH